MKNAELIDSIVYGKISDWIETVEYKHEAYDTWEDSYSKLERCYHKDVDFLIGICKKLADQLDNIRASQYDL